MIGEDPRGTPNNLMPHIAQVAVGKRPMLQIFVDDYVHVVDLAEGHVTALRHLLDGDASLAVNLGTGRGTSVLELVHALERASVGRRRTQRATAAATYALSDRARSRARPLYAGFASSIQGLDVGT